MRLCLLCVCVCVSISISVCLCVSFQSTVSGLTFFSHFSDVTENKHILKHEKCNTMSSTKEMFWLSAWTSSCEWKEIRRMKGANEIIAKMKYILWWSFGSKCLRFVSWPIYRLKQCDQNPFSRIGAHTWNGGQASIDQIGLSSVNLEGKKSAQNHLEIEYRNQFTRKKWTSLNKITILNNL